MWLHSHWLPYKDVRVTTPPVQMKILSVCATMAGVVEERDCWYCRVVVTTFLTEDLSAKDDTLTGSRVSDDLLWDCVT